jgi:D-alanyl-D-alanine carboxypeptidase
VDGIKTGFTRASGFNLVTSVHRGGRYLVAVVMGGHSSFERDAHMRELISAHIKQAALQRAGPVIVQHDQHQSLAEHFLAGLVVIAHDGTGVRYAWRVSGAGRSERVPGRSCREFEIADIVSEP